MRFSLFTVSIKFLNLASVPELNREKIRILIPPFLQVDSLDRCSGDNFDAVAADANFRDIFAKLEDLAVGVDGWIVPKPSDDFAENKTGFQLI